jgi:hypothetical protein
MKRKEWLDLKIVELIDSPAKECVEWKFATDSRYGMFQSAGKRYKVHRYALESFLGRRLLPGCFALHNCDNPPCFNPFHLYEGTKSDNEKDKVRRGRHNTAKLSSHDVQQIIALRKEGKSLRGIGKIFGVSGVHVLHLTKHS